MSNFNPADSGYVEVNKRIEEFYAKYPNGSIQTEIVHLNDTLVIIKAYAFRAPDDPRPSTGLSQMPIPGLTQFTKNSEVENCETSAVGRAIANLGFEVKRSVASANEIRNKTAEERSTKAPVSQEVKQADSGNTAKISETQKRHIFSLRDALGLDNAKLGALRLEQTGKRSSAQMTEADGEKLIAYLEGEKAKVAATGGELVPA